MVLLFREPYSKTLRWTHNKQNKTTTNKTKTTNHIQITSWATEKGHDHGITRPFAGQPDRQTYGCQFPNTETLCSSTKSKFQYDLIFDWYLHKMFKPSLLILCCRNYSSFASLNLTIPFWPLFEGLWFHESDFEIHDSGLSSRAIWSHLVSKMKMGQRKGHYINSCKLLPRSRFLGVPQNIQKSSRVLKVISKEFVDLVWVHVWCSPLAAFAFWWKGT